MPSPQKIMIHLGTHKTATSHFQATLEQNQKAINDLGVSVYTPKYLRGKGFTTWNPIRGRGPNANLEFVEEKMRSLSHAGRKVVFSEENLIGSMSERSGHARKRFYTHADLYLQMFVNMHPETVVDACLSIRNPATLLPSIYTFGLFQGRMMSFDEFLNGIDPAELRWSELIARLRVTEGLSKLVIWKYEDYARLQRKIMRRIIIWRMGALAEPVMENVNPGLSQKAMDEILATGLQNCDEKKVKELRDAYPIGLEHPKFQPFSEVERERITQAYQKDWDLIQSLEAVEILS